MKLLCVPVVRLEAIVRWTARVLAITLLAIVFVPFVVNNIYDVIHGFYKDGLPHALWVTGVEPIQVVAFCITCFGLVLAWRWQVIGGALSLGGMILFFAVAFAVHGG